MATSAFKSTTKRASIGGSEDSFPRRSRSLSRFSRPDTDYNKFVNTKRGSDASPPFPEISLDDLALEFFSSSSLNDNESDGGVAERDGRSVSRRNGVGRWASDTASSSSRRKGRSVSRHSEVGRLASDTASSGRKGRSVSRSRGDVVSSSSVVGAKKVISSDGASRRRRSLSVARYQISDSESEADHSRKSSNRSIVKAPINGNSQMPLAPKATASSNRRLGISRSHKDLSLFHDGYSSHSSALTDEESKDTHRGKNGFEKIIRAVYAQKKADHPTEDVANGGLYEAMRKELRYAVEEIRTELNQAIGRNQTALGNGDCLQSENVESLQDFSRAREKYATKFEELEKHKEGLLTDTRNAIAAEKPSRARKRSNDRSRTSKKLIEETERYFEDFVCSVEDTDISSFDGEKSDGSSTLGGTVKARSTHTAIREAETCRSPAGYNTPQPVEMDGVILPWLQWETAHDGSPLGKKTPVTPKALQRDLEKDMDASGHSMSSHGSWSPGLYHSPPTDKRRQSIRQVGISCFDMDDYLKPCNNEEVLFEMYRERNRISSGGLLLCTGFLY